MEWLSLKEGKSDTTFDGPERVAFGHWSRSVNDLDPFAIRM